MGSMHEVGYWEGAIDENTPCNPISLYGIAKDSLRRAMTLYCKTQNVIFQWLRCFYIYGDDKSNNSIFSKILCASESGIKEFPFTSGKNQYDFINVDELSKLLSYCICQNKINGIINCCSGKPVSLADKVGEFITDHNLDIKLLRGKYPDRPYDSPVIYGNINKIMKILNNRVSD